jgi:phosphoserine aminotransferase
MTDAVQIPDAIKPADGRFGSGPSKVRAEALAALADRGSDVMGTSHRKPAVKNLVARTREGVAQLLGLPEGYEVVLGNGGTTAFWDAAAFGLVRKRAQHLSFGEFSSKFATVTATAPWLSEPSVIKAEPGTLAGPHADDSVDVYAWPHNETSTGVMAPVRRVTGAPDDALRASARVICSYSHARAVQIVELLLSISSWSPIATEERLARTERSQLCARLVTLWVQEFYAGPL